MLSEREKQILSFLADGRCFEDIGKELFISKPTVKRHSDNARNKLGACNCCQAVAIAIREGYID